MKNMKKYSFLAILSVILFAGCYNEGALTPTKLDKITGKFEFPQGTSEADEIFERIFEKYGTQVIYKDFTEADLNRSWMSPTGNMSTTPATYEYITDPDALLEAARTIEDKILGLMPEDVMRRVLRSYPYIYLTDNLKSYDMAGEAYVEFFYPVRALDGITINLQLNADADDYVYKVYYPLRIALEFFNQAFSQGLITVPEEFYSLYGPQENGRLVTFQRSLEDPSSYDNYWARQGRLPYIGSFTGVANLSKTYLWRQNSLLEPLTADNRETPWFFVFLSTDRNWRTYDDGQGVVDNTNQGVFYDCPRIVDRLELFYDSMQEQGIDFDEIQRRLYDDEDDNSTVVTNPW